MKILSKRAKINEENLLVLSFDVSQKKLDCYGEYGKDIVNSIEDTFNNSTRKIENKLKEYDQVAKSVGLKGLHILCEPTGGYERKLLRTARRKGYTTAIVNTESVCKLKVVESNDSGKTDTKDPRIMSMLSKLGKTLISRELKGEYKLLRDWNTIVEDEDRELVRTRCLIHRKIQELFCDYSKNSEFLYSKSGRALIKRFGYNPCRIVERGFETFVKVMKREVPRIKNATLKTLWEDANSSVLHQLNPEEIALLEKRLRQLWEDYETHVRRKKEARGEMEALYYRLGEKDETVPEPVKGVFSAYTLARILGETGPLTDFDNISQILRYAGLNLRERKSGKYVGQVKISKKGRSLLRKILSQAIYPLVRRGNLYGKYYHGKREKGMVKMKAMVAVMRKFLKMFYRMSVKKEGFNEQRVFTCEGRFKLAA
jgi:transposase